MLPFFLEQAREWWAVADKLRARGVSDEPALWVWREAAWCHLLLTKGLYGAAVTQLGKVFRDVAGVDPPTPMPRPRCEADVLAFANDLFALLRSIVSARYPFAFGRPVAA